MRIASASAEAADSTIPYYGENIPLRDGLDIGHTLVLLGVAGVGLWLSILAFDRRDIHA